MILPAQALRKLKPVRPFHERSVKNGMTYGLGPAGYDVRIAQDVVLYAYQFSLASTMEEFDTPNDTVAFVHDKSTWARKGLSLFNTVIEPSWRGFLTLELVNNTSNTLTIPAGSPIAQVIWMRLEEATDQPYSGRYQNQEAGPVAAKFFDTQEK